MDPRRIRGIEGNDRLAPDQPASANSRLTRAQSRSVLNTSMPASLASGVEAEPLEQKNVA
jgi:hypothetical protein